MQAEVDQNRRFYDLGCVLEEHIIPPLSDSIANRM